ncbi:MAG: modified peptide precursor CbpA [bacterium]
MKSKSKANVIASRRKCRPTGAGLSHYILMQAPVKRSK